MNQYRQKLKPSSHSELELPAYIKLCFLFQHSGANKTEIQTIFEENMILVEDYDEESKQELLDYLYKIAQ